MAPRSGIGKRALPKSPETSPNGKKLRQQGLLASFAVAANRTPSSRLPPTEAASELPSLPYSLTNDLEAAVDAYCQSWGDKCAQTSNLTRAAAANKDEVDLDGRGLHLVAQFRHAVGLAKARAESIPPKYLEALVLVIRSDVVHQKSQVSRVAAGALTAYLRDRPFASVRKLDEGENVSPLCVVISPGSVWLPLEEDRASFTSKHLLVPDVTVSGRNYKADLSESAGVPGPSRQRRDGKWSCPFELFLHSVEKAVASEEEDFNGDLLLAQYLVEVMVQDLKARMDAIDALGRSRWADSFDGQRRRQSMLENSVAWRIFVSNNCAGSDALQRLVHGLVTLIGADADRSSQQHHSNDAALISAAEDPDDDAPAGACIYTRRELAGFAGQLLCMLMALLGSAENAGAFHDEGRYRTESSRQNQRVNLDAALLKAVWSEAAAVKTPAGAAAVVRALQPRDGARLLGLLASQKFARTYGADISSLGNFLRVVGDIAEPLQDAASMLSGRGGDVQQYLDVPLAPVAASLHREASRAVKSYKGLEHLTVVLAGLASTVHARKARGQRVLAGSGGSEALQRELNDALKAAAGQAQAQLRQGQDMAANQLTGEGLAKLVVARMAVMSM